MSNTLLFILLLTQTNVFNQNFFLCQYVWLENNSHQILIKSESFFLPTKKIIQCSIMMISRFVQNLGFILIKFQPRLQNANLNNSKLLYSLKTKAFAFKVEIYLSFSYKTKKIYKHDRLMSIYNDSLQ